MSLFKYNVYLPSLDKEISLREITNREHMELVKLIVNDDDDQINTGFNKLIRDCCDSDTICDELTKVDCFCVLLMMHIVCVSGTLKLKMQDEYGSILNLDISEILDKIASYEQKYTQTIRIDKNISIKLRIPRDLHDADLDRIVLNSIDSIRLFNTQYDIKSLDIKQKRTAFERLPSEISDRVIQKMRQINDNYQIKLFDIGENQPMVINMYSNGMYEFIKMMYKTDLESLYYNRYIAAKHMKYSNEYVETITPAELQLHMKFLEKEIADQKKEYEKQQGNSSPSVGGMPPAPGSI